MKNNKLNRLKGGFTLVELLVVIGIIASLAALSTPAVTNALKTAARTTSVNNAKQIKTALDLYAMDFDGEFVGDTNASTIDSAISTVGDAATAFQLLIEAGTLSSADEPLFYTKELRGDVSTHTKGDANGTLTDNENGYSYVKNLTSTSSGAAPIVTTKVASATGTFYTGVWEHRAIIARVNGAVEAVRMSGPKDNNSTVTETVEGSSGSNIFDWATGAGGTIVQ